MRIKKAKSNLDTIGIDQDIVNQVKVSDERKKAQHEKKLKKFYKLNAKQKKRLK